ncbi:NAD(P)-binding protein [Psychrobacter urativorans]|uniref:NAD(P)-binding protein n=1 Tax=Psychrobacter urativorans TaxID=45610 RepID=UPI0019196CA3|nr:NAD(P)-binding protein [Psychrobacter urativorans]
MSDLTSKQTNSENNMQNAKCQHDKKKILIAGGGISGLTAAFELSEDSSLDITIVESRDSCGGKMIGYFNTDEQRFEEHSIRALSSTYFSLFNIFDRAGLLHMLTPVDDYQFYQSGNGSFNDENKDDADKDGASVKKGKRVAIDRRAAIDLQTIESMIVCNSTLMQQLWLYHTKYYGK